MKYLLFLLSLVIIYSSVTVYAQGKIKVKSTGYGKTERDALEDARRKAVSEGIEELFSDRPQQKDIIKDKITDKPSAYLKDEEVINKSFDEETKKWEIKIKAVVSRSDIEKDIRGISSLLDRANRPKILVLSTFYSEDTQEKKLTDLAVNTINEYLGKLGFTYISQDAVFNIMRQLNSYSGAQSIRDIAMKADAPYYISVNITPKEEGTGAGGAYYSSANVNLEAYDTENATGIGTTNQSSGKVGNMTSQNEANFTAVKEAAEKAAEEIVQQILMNLNRQVERGFTYEIRLFGMNDYMLAREFKNALTSHSGFSGDIRMSKMDDYYRFEITFKSPRPDEVTDAIFDALVGKSTFRKMNLKSASGKLLNFEM